MLAGALCAFVLTGARDVRVVPGMLAGALCAFVLAGV
jgi:hypothetical protein